MRRFENEIFNNPSGQIRLSLFKEIMLWWEKNIAFILEKSFDSLAVRLPPIPF